jgi:hypothetical protein
MRIAPNTITAFSARHPIGHLLAPCVFLFDVLWLRTLT